MIINQSISNFSSLTISSPFILVFFLTSKFPFYFYCFLMFYLISLFAFKVYSWLDNDILTLILYFLRRDLAFTLLNAPH